MTALKVYGVLAPEKSVLLLQQMRVVPRKDCLSSRGIGMNGIIFLPSNCHISNLLGGE